MITSPFVTESPSSDHSMKFSRCSPSTSAVGVPFTQMERFVEQALLYDFYGELLTENQKQVFEDVVLNDYSLTEVAEEKGISRQGVHDLIRRCDKILLQYEEKLNLVHKFTLTKEMVSQIEALSARTEGTDYEKNLNEIHLLAENIMKEL